MYTKVYITPPFCTFIGTLKLPSIFSEILAESGKKWRNVSKTYPKTGRSPYSPICATFPAPRKKTTPYVKLLLDFGPEFFRWA
jgi:hypothetical protein